MITTETPYACGELLSRTLSEQNEPPGFVSFLSQGAAVGALLMFPTPVMGVISIDPYYGLLFVASLPMYLPMGAGVGILEAIIIWACTYVRGRQLNVALRIGIAIKGE